jgi:membrane-associated phospholipid phosphatase
MTEALDRRLVSRRLRPAVASVIVLAAGFAAALGLRYAGGSSAGRVDRAIDASLVGRLGKHGRLVQLLADLGDPVPILIGTLLLVILLILLARPRGALLAATAPTLASAITVLIGKPLVDRRHGGGLAFPSGHATAFCAVAFVVTVVALDQRRPRLPRPLQAGVAAVALGLATCVAAALVAAQYHYATDTWGGACVALGTVLTVSLAIDWWADRRARGDSARRCG